MRMSCGRLEDFVRQLAARAGMEPVVEELRSTPWSSITFSGARHRLALRFEGKGAKMVADRLSEGLDYAEFNLDQQLLADIAVVECGGTMDSATLTIEALTISEE